MKAFMKKNIVGTVAIGFGIKVIISLILILSLSACSSNNDSSIEKKDFGENNPLPQRNLSDENKVDFMEEQKQIALAACENKVEGDVCTIENPRGSLTATCMIKEELLLCTPPNNMRPEGR